MQDDSEIGSTSVSLGRKRHSGSVVEEQLNFLPDAAKRLRDWTMIRVPQEFGDLSSLCNTTSQAYNNLTFFRVKDGKEILPEEVFVYLGFGPMRSGRLRRVRCPCGLS